MPAKGSSDAYTPPRLHVLLALLVVAMVAAGCGSSDSASPNVTATSTNPPPTKVTLALDWYPNPDHVGIYAGLDSGFFTRAGLEVDPLTPADVSDPVKFVAAGRADLGVSYEPEMFFAAEKHIPVVAVAALVPTALNSIIARTDRGIHTVADLQGKTIGVDGSASTTAYVKTVLETAHVPGRFGASGDRRVQPDPGAALGQGRRHRRRVPEHRGHRGPRRTGCKTTVFPVDRHGVPSYDELVIIANRDRLQSDAGYRRSVRAFVTALGKSTAWARAHQAAAIAIMRAHSSRDYRGQIAKSVPATLKLLRTSRLDPAAWTAVWSLDVSPWTARPRA